MARVHTDLHFISNDDVNKILKFCIENNIQVTSFKDVRCNEISIKVAKYRDKASVLQISSIW